MTHATETPITDDLIQALAAKHLNDKEYKAVTFTRWRDGIDVDYPTVGLVKFANAIRADAAESALRSAGEGVREECAKVLDRRANGQTEAKLENWRDGYTDTGNECSWAAVCLAEAAEEIRALPVQGEVKINAASQEKREDAHRADGDGALPESDSPAGAAPTEPPVAGAKGVGE